MHYYRDAARDQEIPGLMNVVVGGYHVGDVKFVAAFDVDKKKVGLDLSDAIWLVKTTPLSSPMFLNQESRS